MDLSMDKLQSQLREKARELLEKGEVAAVIGWGRGWNPVKASPLFARDNKAVEDLAFNTFCFNNLAVYLPRMAEKVAIMTKSCEQGSIVALLAEGKISRDNIYVIGVACKGVVDQTKLEKAIGPVDEAAKAYLDGDTVVVEFNDGDASDNGSDGKSGVKRVPLAEVVSDSCKSCNPDLSFADVVIGEGRSMLSGEAISQVPENADAAWWRAFWAKEFDRCIRCYACREACPACYCRDNCAVQALREQWTGATINPAEALMFHAQRAMHVAGRCTECGACERACPVGIPLTLLHNQVGKAVHKLFGFNVGEKTDERPPLETFRKEEL